MFKTLAHICLRVRDLEVALGFYQGKLGLRQAFELVNKDGKRLGVYLRVGERSFLELFEREHSEWDEKQSYSHFCLEVDDIERAVGELRERGVHASPITMGQDNSWQSWIADPDGNRIELHCYTRDSKQLSMPDGCPTSGA